MGFFVSCVPLPFVTVIDAAEELGFTAYFMVWGVSSQYALRYRLGSYKSVVSEPYCVADVAFTVGANYAGDFGNDEYAVVDDEWYINEQGEYCAPFNMDDVWF